MEASTLVVIGLAVVGVCVALFIAFRITRERRLPTVSLRRPDNRAAPLKRAEIKEKLPPGKEVSAKGERSKIAERGKAVSEAVSPADAQLAETGEVSVEFTEEEIASKPAIKAEVEIPQRPSLVARAAKEETLAALKKGLTTTRGGLVSRLTKLFLDKKEIKPELLEEIEEVLITADVGTKTAAKILSVLQSQMQAGELLAEENIWRAIKSKAQQILSVATEPFALKNRPAVILVVGVNGVGKTTTIGKLAHRFKTQGKKVVLAAGDTFRAAAVLQLEVWGRRVECPVIKGKEQGDPSSVVFDAVKKAIDEGFDVVIADTAGRLHTKVPLMEELKKLSRTASKALGGRPVDEIFLVLDATIGQNAVQQAQIFKESLEGISGIVLTKMDGTAKGGVILAIADEHQIPVRFVGLGEKLEDLREFNEEDFVEALFSKAENETNAT